MSDVKRAGEERVSSVDRLSPAERNVFLVPFDRGNFGRTMNIHAPVELWRHPERPHPLSELEVAYLWGARAGSRNLKMFNQMVPGDLLLFYHRDHYVRFGLVGITFEDSTGWVKRTFWGGAPSKHIYTVVDYQSILMTKEEVNDVIGYDPDYIPRGLIKVKQPRLSSTTLYRVLHKRADATQPKSE